MFVSSNSGLFLYSFRFKYAGCLGVPRKRFKTVSIVLLSTILNSSIIRIFARLPLAESDDVTKNNSNHSDEENALPKDYSYTTVTFEYEADMPVRQSGAKNQGSKYQIDKIGFAQDGKSAKLSPKHGDFEYKNKDDKVREKRYRDERFKEDKERHKEERRKEKKNGDYVLSEKKGFKKNNSRFEKNNSYRRNDRRQEKSSH